MQELAAPRQMAAAMFLQPAEQRGSGGDRLHERPAVLHLPRRVVPLAPFIVDRAALDLEDEDALVLVEDDEIRLMFFHAIVGIQDMHAMEHIIIIGQAFFQRMKNQFFRAIVLGLARGVGAHNGHVHSSCRSKATKSSKAKPRSVEKQCQPVFSAAGKLSLSFSKKSIMWHDGNRQVTSKDVPSDPSAR